MFSNPIQFVGVKYLSCTKNHLETLLHPLFQFIECIAHKCLLLKSLYNGKTLLLLFQCAPEILCGLLEKMLGVKPC